MGKNHSNEYCESCKKFHKPGIHSKSVIDPLVKGDPKALMRFMRRIGYGMYFSRDMLGDDKSFTESDVVKEVKKSDKILISPNVFEDDDKNDESGTNSEENK